MIFGAIQKYKKNISFPRSKYEETKNKYDGK